MSKQLIKNYTFSSAAKTITLTDFTTLSLERLQLITDVTTNQILYNFADSSVSTATVAGNVITLSTVGTAGASDKLMVIYDVASGDPVYDGYKEVSFTTTTVQALATTDVSNYSAVSVHIVTQGTGSTVTFQTSNDNVNWVTKNLHNASSTNGMIGSTTSAGLIAVGALVERYFRVNVTGISAGTTAGVVEFSSKPYAYTQTIAQAVQNGTWSVGSNSATGSAVPANVFPMGIQSAASTLIALRSAASAGINNGGDNDIAAVGFIYNGTNYDAIKAASSAAGTTGTGVPAAGMLGFDGTNYQRVATDAAGFVKVLGSSATGAAVPVNAVYLAANNAGNLQGIQTAGNIGDANAGGAVLDTGIHLYNGATFDRNRNNWNGLTGDTGAKTASFTGFTQTNYNAAGANIVFEIGTVSGTSPTLTAQVQGSADGGTTWFNITGAVTPSITASGVYVLTVYPGTTPVANAAVATPLPRTWRLSYTIGGTTPSFTLTSVRAAYNN